MRERRGAAVYRVCADAAQSWSVFDDLSEQPLASFSNKTSALTYAICLARGGVTWQLLLLSTGSAAAHALLPVRRF